MIDDERRLIREFEHICIDYERMTFRFDGIRSFGNWLLGKRVLAVNIEPSHELVEFRSELVKELSAFCKLGKYDKDHYVPHATLAFKDIDRKYGAIKEYIDTIQVPPIKHQVLRITLLKHGTILCEFDLFQRRMLNRREAINKEISKSTIRLMKARV